MGQRWRSGWARRCKTRAEEAKMTVHHLCRTRLPTAAGAEGLYTASWSYHVHGTPLKFPFPLKERRGLEQSQQHGGQPSIFWPPCSTAPEGSLPWGQWLPSPNNLTHQLIQCIPTEKVLLPYSQEKHWNTNSFQILESTVESVLQDIPWLYDAFSLGLCYSPSLKIIARKEIIPTVSALKQTFTTTTSPHPCLTQEQTSTASPTLHVPVL